MSDYTKEQALQAEIAAMLAAEGKSPEIDSITSPIESPESIEPAGINLEPVEAYVPKDEWEEKALKIGWDPNKTGDNAVPAKEYVLRKPLFERIEKQSKELRDVKESQRKHAEHLAQVRKEAYEQAIKDVEKRRDAAIDDANSYEARRLDAEAKNLHKQREQDPIANYTPEVPDIDPTLADFGKRNEGWYNETSIENKNMKAAANAVDSFLVQAANNEGRQIDLATHLATIEMEVKRMFPHRFPSEVVYTAGAEVSSEAKKPVAIPSVGKSTAVRGDVKSATNLVARLTPQQRELGNRFARDGYSLEEYAKELEKSGRLGK